MARPSLLRLLTGSEMKLREMLAGATDILEQDSV
jgi:hypothetical protein